MKEKMKEKDITYQEASTESARVRFLGEVSTDLTELSSCQHKEGTVTCTYFTIFMPKSNLLLKRNPIICNDAQGNKL